MPAPDIVRVKLSSEAAGAISITPVVVREMPLRELIEEIAAVRGKDPVRIAESLRRGSVTSGATRFRWEPVQMSESELVAALKFLPDDEPGRAFDASRCTQACFTGPDFRVSVAREVAEARRLFRRTSFWAELIRLAGAAQYASYSYRERADIFRAGLAVAQRDGIRAALPTLRHPALARRIHIAAFDAVEFVVKR